jgi:hypothetical protein
MTEWRPEEQQMKIAIEGLVNAEISDRVLDTQKVFELANKAYTLSISQDYTERAKLFGMAWFELSADAASVTPAYRPIQSDLQKSQKKNGRGERIRTSDPLVPNQVRYQTALRPE